jgi:hypothetical protein
MAAFLEDALSVIATAAAGKRSIDLTQRREVAKKPRKRLTGDRWDSPLCLSGFA